MIYPQTPAEWAPLLLQGLTDELPELLTITADHSEAEQPWVRFLHLTLLSFSFSLYRYGYRSELQSIKTGVVRTRFILQGFPMLPK